MRSFAEDPELLLSDHVTDEKGARVFHFDGLKPHKNAFLAWLEGIDNREDAEKLKRTKLYIEREHLPEVEEGEIYHVDMIGMMVHENEKEIGKVIAVQNFGASDLLEIQRQGAKNFYLPYTADTILNVQDNVISVAIPNGLLELYD